MNIKWAYNVVQTTTIGMDNIRYSCSNCKLAAADTKSFHMIWKPFFSYNAQTPQIAVHVLAKVMLKKIMQTLQELNLLYDIFVTCSTYKIQDMTLLFNVVAGYQLIFRELIAVRVLA